MKYLPDGMVMVGMALAGIGFGLELGAGVGVGVVGLMVFIMGIISAMRQAG